jgi:cyclophilin family peptidyl-prolyl cis-trans isomerase
MPSADKRARKKDNARAAREQREAALKRKKQFRSAITVGIVVVIFVGVIILLNVAGGSKKKKPVASATTTSVATSTTAPAAPVLPAGCVRTVPPKTTKPTYKSAPAMTIDASKTYVATFATSCGTFTATLDAKDEPKGVNNFVFLAKNHFYDGLTWHRVVKDFVIQGGDPKGDGSGGPGYSVVTETPKDGYPLGTLAWAKTGTDPNGTAGSQFFVVTGSSTSALSQKTNGSYQYGAFGKVTSGIANAEKIMSLAPASGDGAPTIPMYIFKITITES